MDMVRDLADASLGWREAENASGLAVCIVRGLGCVITGLGFVIESLLGVVCTVSRIVLC